MATIIVGDNMHKWHKCLSFEEGKKYCEDWRKRFWSNTRVEIMEQIFMRKEEKNEY